MIAMIRSAYVFNSPVAGFPGTAVAGSTGIPAITAMDRVRNKTSTGLS
jgi:hypothetical protein